MDHEGLMQSPPSTEVQMVEAEIVRQIRALAELGWGMKRIARETGAARGTVRRYLRSGTAAERQSRPLGWTLSAAERALAIELLEGPAEGNAVVVQRILAERGVVVPLRTLQRTIAPHRAARRAAEVATVRFETAPGHQLQIDFGEKRVAIAGVLVTVHLFVAVLGYSRRIFVRASLSERQDDWFEGLSGAFRLFGGTTQTVLVDRARALIVGQDRERGTARVHPAFAAFCRDFGVEVRACQAYRAQTKGKTESGVGYVKRNALAGLAFASFGELEAHLARWMVRADQRIHGTTHEQPLARFDRDERAALRPLPANPIPVRQRRVTRRVAIDCFVDVDTVRYSVPHALVRRTVEVCVGDDEVVITHGAEVVARHRRSSEPHSRVVIPAHFDGLWRRRDADEELMPVLAPLGRSLDDYAAVIGGEP